MFALGCTGFGLLVGGGIAFVLGHLVAYRDLTREAAVDRAQHIAACAEDDGVAYVIRTTAGDEYDCSYGPMHGLQRLAKGKR
jgi:hypothetical protein